MKRILWMLFLFLGSFIFLKAETGQAGSAGAYLRMGPGARALGMGSAFVAVSDDASAIHWNVAGISQIRKKELLTMHSVMDLDRNYDYIGFINPLSKGSWGISWINAGVDQIERYDGAGTLTGYFDDKENSYIFSYATPLGKFYRIGANFKYLRHDILNYSADSFAFDLGFMAEISSNIQFGLSLRNLAGKMKWDTSSRRSDDIPFSAVLGVAYQYKNFLMAFDIDKTEDLDTKLNIGAEYKLHKNLSLRAGSHDGEFTLGVGLLFKNWTIDYAWEDSELGDNHRISGTILFGNEKEENNDNTIVVTPDEEKKIVSSKKVESTIKAPQKKTSSPAKKITIKVDPRKIIKLYEEGNNLLVNKKYQEAISIYKKIIKIDPNYADAYYKIGIAYIMAQQTPKAKPYLKKGLELDPENNYAKYAQVILK